MRLLVPISALLLIAGASTGLLAFQRGGYGGYGEDQYGNAREAFSSSGNENGKSEYSWSRLRYSSANSGGGFGYGYGRGGTWHQDYPKADRQFLIALKRLTRINARPVEQVVDLDAVDATGSPLINNFPWVYAVQVH